MIRSTEQERPTLMLTVMEAMISLKVQIGGSRETPFMEMTPVIIISVTTHYMVSEETISLMLVPEMIS